MLFRNIAAQEDQNMRANSTSKRCVRAQVHKIRTHATPEMKYNNPETPRRFIAPDFGGLLTSLESTNRFYKYWEKFDSHMSFEWADVYSPQMARCRRIPTEELRLSFRDSSSSYSSETGGKG